MSETKLAKKGKPKHLKLILQGIFFLALTVFAIYYILKDDPKKTFSVLIDAKALPLTIGIVVVLVTMLLDGLSLTLQAKPFHKKYHFYQGVINSMIGGLVGVYVKTASPIIQAYTFTKQNVKSSEAASILTMNFLLYQLSLCVYSLLIVILGYPIMDKVPLPLLWNMKLIYLVILGMFVQVSFLVITILLAFCRPLHRFILNSGINFLAKLRILRKPEETRRKLTIQFATYRIEMKRMRQNIPMVIEVLLINFVKLFLLGCLPFLVMLSLVPNGLLNKEFFAQSLTGTGFINVISSFITVGVPEIIFQDTFSYFLTGIKDVADPATIASAGNILWRLFTFYLIFIIGALATIFYRGSPKRAEILSNTGTIYDLEIQNFDVADKDTKDYLNEIKKKGNSKEAPLLSEKEIENSFMEIRNQITEKEESSEENSDKELEEILKENQHILANAEKEYEEMAKSQPSKKEIQDESEHELSWMKEKNQKKRLKKAAKIKKKKEKTLAKEKKEFMKHQPNGSTITIDENKGIEIHSPEFMEIKTFTTSDPEEDKHHK